MQFQEQETGEIAKSKRMKNGVLLVNVTSDLSEEMMNVAMTKHPSAVMMPQSAVTMAQFAVMMPQFAVMMPQFAVMTAQSVAMIGLHVLLVKRMIGVVVVHLPNEMKGVKTGGMTGAMRDEVGMPEGVGLMTTGVREDQDLLVVHLLPSLLLLVVVVVELQLQDVMIVDHVALKTMTQEIGDGVLLVKTVHLLEMCLFVKNVDRFARTVHQLEMGLVGPKKVQQMKAGQQSKEVKYLTCRIIP